MKQKNQPLACNENYGWYNGDVSVTGEGFDITAKGVAYGNGYFIVVCEKARIYRSPDGIKWEKLSPPRTTLRGEQHYFGIDYDPVHKVWIAAGRDGMIIKSKDDGKSWSEAYNSGKSDDLILAVSGSGVLLVISEGGQVFRSTDGGNKWSNYTWKGPLLRCITFAQGVFAAGGYDGGIFYSSDGKKGNWTQVKSGTKVHLRAIAYSPGLDLWVAGGYDVCTGKDLHHLTCQFKIKDEFKNSKGKPLPYQVYCGVGGDGFAILAGEHGMMLTTTDPDGRAWAPRKSGSGGYIYDMANHPDGTLVVNVGNALKDLTRKPDSEWRYPFRYNDTKWINPNNSPVYAMSGNTVVDEIDAEFIPLKGHSDVMRAECHLRKDSRGDLWASIHYFGLYHSTDSGKTWEFKKNDLVMKDVRAYSYFTILNDDTFLLGKVKDGWAPSEEEKEKGVKAERTPILFYRSDNHGDSWKQAGEIHAAPFEAISEGTQNLTQLADGTILYPASRYNWKPDPEEPDAERENVIFRSTDGGRSWGDKSKTYTKGLDKYVFEPHIIQLQSGKLLGVFRYQRRVQNGDTKSAVTAAGGNWSCREVVEKDKETKKNIVVRKSIFNQLYIGESDDNGYTWKNLHDIRDADGKLLLYWGDPHGTLLQVPDGRVVLVYDHRCQYERDSGCKKENAWQVSNRAVVSEDEGATWGPEIYHLSYGKGYPSSVALDDGTIVTVTGNRLEGATFFTAMAVRWKLPVKSTITVTSPNGGEIWGPGSAQDITWTSSGKVGNVRIEFSINNGESWDNVIEKAKNDGHHRWVDVPGTLSENCLVRVSEIDGELSDTSDAVFSIALPPQSITITSPNGGETWQAGTSETITWDTRGISGNVKITLWKDGKKIGDIAEDVDYASGSYHWTVGQHGKRTADAGTGYSIRVKCMKRGERIYDDSDAGFSIELPPQPITIKSPRGGESWQTGTSKTITWDTRGISGDVMITLWKDGDRIGTIADNIDASQGSYDWTVGRHSEGSAPVGTGYKIRIKGKKRGERVYDDSADSFTLTN